MRDETYKRLTLFTHKFKGNVIWRAKKHCSIVDKHLNPAERLLFVFGGQLNDSPLNIIDTGIVALTTERIIVAQKGLIFGYKFISITPDLYNDLSIKSRIIWGTVTIDTVKEKVNISNIAKNALPEVETQITSFMDAAKKEYLKKKNENK